MILRCTPGTVSLPQNVTEYNPDIEHLYGTRETFLHAYGKLPYVTLSFLDQTQAYKMFNMEQGVSKIVKILQQHIRGIAGGKIIHKRPGIYAAAGPHFMLKLYLGGDCSLSLYHLRQFLENSTHISSPLSGLFAIPDLHHSQISVYADWLTSRQAPVHGELSIYDNYKMDSHTHDSTLPYDVRDVYYKDVHNGTLVGSNRDGNSSLLHGICGQIGRTTSRECITCDCPRDGSVDTIKKRHHEEQQQQQQQQQQPQNDYVDIHKDETKDRLLSNP